MHFHLKCTHESLRAVFRRQNGPQLGRGWVRLSTSKRRHCGDQRGRFDGNGGLSARPWNLIRLASLTPRARFNVFVWQYFSIVINVLSHLPVYRKKLLSKFTSRARSSFHLENKLHQFSKEWKLWWVFFHGHSNTFLGQDNPIYRN